MVWLVEAIRRNVITYSIINIVKYAQLRFLTIIIIRILIRIIATKRRPKTEAQDGLTWKIMNFSIHAISLFDFLSELF